MLKSLALLLNLLIPTAVFAAGDGAKDFDYSVKLRPYLTTDNTAALTFLNKEHFSVASLDATKQDGALVGLEGSDNSFKAGASSESFVRISDKIAFYGKLSYSYFYGKNMGGQVFIDPSLYPVNFLESTDTTVGVKTREMYNLSGGLCYTFNSRWSAGFKADYWAGDQAKARDPRFLNSWMSISLNAGAYFKPSEKLGFGLSAIFRNTNESVYGKIFGTTDKQYFILTDKGGFWGTKAGLDGDYNYMPTSSQRGMLNNYYGGGLQCDVNNQSLSLHNEMKALYRTGYWGKKTSSSPVFFEYSGPEISYSGALVKRSAQNIHRINLDASFKTLVCSENDFDYSTPQGGGTVVVYKAQNEQQNRMETAAALGYTFYGKADGYLPGSELGLDCNFNYLGQNTEIYPFYRDNSYGHIEANLRARKNIAKGKNYFCPGVTAGFRTGFGVEKEDGSYAQATSKLISFDSYLYRNFEYQTSPRAGASLSFTYLHRFNDRTSLFVTASDTLQSLLKQPQYLKGRFRNQAVLTVGCNF